jgi:Archaeal PaREP1/PaREP8 family.
MNIQARVFEYVKNAEKYLVNASEMLAKKDYNKSGEMLWGSIAELIKALGMVHGKDLLTHRIRIDFIKELAISLQDDELRRLVVERMRALRANFYWNFIEVEDFPAYYHDACKAYKRLYEVIEKDENQLTFDDKDVM